jgi:hypothetical protein
VTDIPNFPTRTRQNSKREEGKMNGLDERTKTRLEFILDEVCATLPQGGDHESRKFIAEQLVLCARAGRTTLEELAYAGQRALVQLRRASSARDDDLIDAG